MFFDTHCHTYLSKQKSEIDILEEIKKNNNLYITNIGVDLETSQHCIDIASKHDFAYATVGIHPCDVLKYPNLEETINKLENLAKNKKVVAIGECGLDYYRLEKECEESVIASDNEAIQKTGNNSENGLLRTSQGQYSEGQLLLNQKKSHQKEFFKAQISLAKKLDLPLMIHNREAGDDILEILQKSDFKNFIMHCYSENLEYALKLLDFAPDCMISFSGILTFNSAKNVQETASKIPLKNILIETDSPYLAPAPFRGQENYPYLVEKVFEKLCSLRSESPEIIKKAILENSLKVFGI